MAKEIGVSKSTISREFKRNTRWNGYVPGQAQWFSDNRRRKSKKFLKFTSDVEKFVLEKILQDWSPEQISGYAKRHKLFTISHERIYQFILKELNANFYFAHPASWERGLNENTNGLIRQYLRKGCDLSNITDDDLNVIMDKLNNRPRKSLGYATPNEVFLI